MCTRSRMISTFSACADLAGSIAELDSAFHTPAAGDDVEACANPRAAKSETRMIARKTRIIVRSPGTRRENTSSFLRRQVPRDETEQPSRDNGCWRDRKWRRGKCCVCGRMRGVEVV